MPERARPSVGLTPADEDDARRSPTAGRDGRRPAMAPMHPGRGVSLQLACPRAERVGRPTRPLPARLVDPPGARRGRHFGGREVGVDLGGVTQAGLSARSSIGLPVDPFWRRDGGLAFDLVSSYSSGEKVIIGHAKGSSPSISSNHSTTTARSLRIRLGEPYRTMLGHFRHEAGHYYQHVLVETGPGADRYLENCRELFGDERIGYADAIARHDRSVPRMAGEETFISEYATMHPWEDFAECFAHYLHIADSIDTSREAGLVLTPIGCDSPHRAISSLLESYVDVPVERLLFDWQVDGAVLQPGQHCHGQGSRSTPSRSHEPWSPSRVHSPGDPRDRTRQPRRAEWAMPTNCSTSPTGSCWSPAAAAGWAGRWPSPRRAAGPT